MRVLKINRNNFIKSFKISKYYHSSTGIYGFKPRCNPSYSSMDIFYSNILRIDNMLYDCFKFNMRRPNLKLIKKKKKENKYFIKYHEYFVLQCNC